MIKDKKRKPFEPRWVKLPRHWISGLGQSKSASTYRLAHLILWETLKDKRRDGMVILSYKTTKMLGATRRRAARELAELGLIVIEAQGKSTWRAKVL
jgi:hypothetical protein